MGLLGPNGAGKTTTMKILTGYLHPSSGTASVGGHDVVNEPIAVQSMVGYLPENAPLYLDMTVQEYLLMMADLRGIAESDRREYLGSAVHDTGLVDYLVRPIGNLSKGYRQRVGIAQAILHRPKLLILDEPTNGLDPTQIIEVRGLIARLAESATVIVSTHNLAEVEATCHRAIIIMNGRLRADNRLDELRATTSAMVAVDSTEGVPEKLARLEGVREVAAAGERDGFTRYRVTADRNDGLCPSIFDLARQEGWRLSELSRSDQDPGERVQGAGPGRGGGGVNQILTIARKELRSYFLSPVALIFMGTFLFVTLFAFFWVDAFFSRNIADVRPLFSWLPLLTIFLVGALTMRLWSEEQKLGTMEVLLTLPVPTHRLVLGKFLAGLALVGITLALTVSVPFSVAQMGDLDWGPVIGAYVGALLLAAAYLSIGLCISAATDNQIVALIGTCVAGGTLYGVGSRGVTQMFGQQGTELLRSLGTGARFESIQRGVIDARDLVYYGSLIVFFLICNVVLLEVKRWSTGPRTEGRRFNTKLTVALAAANLVALNLWLAPIASVRVDLTERKEYSVSPVTRDLVRSLDAPILIRGYFSAKTHPLLAPLVPRIRDLVTEYGVISGGRVRAEFVDPRDDEELEEEANQAYGIQSFAFRVADRYEAGIVNSYFSILVKYGDQFEVLSFDDLIEVSMGTEDIDVRLRNLEYDLTSAIKKVAYGFQTIETVFADLDQEAEFTAYITPATLPENFQELPERVNKVLADLEEKSGGKLKWSVVDPDQSPDVKQMLQQQFGLRPFAVSLFAADTFYFHLLLRVGESYQQIVPAESMTEADIRNEIEAALKRHTPGFLKTVGIVTPTVPMPPQMPGQPPQAPPQVSRAINETLGETYTTRTVDLSSGRVPGDIDVLLVIGPKDYDAKKQFAIDQYLMRGGTVIVVGGRFQLSPNPYGESLSVEKLDTGLEDVLGTWGVTLDPRMVLDTQNETFPVPVVRDLGFARVREIQQIRYPYFVDVRKDGMDDDNPVVGGLPQVALYWSSPIVVAEKEGIEAETLLSSSPQSWLSDDTNIQPDFTTHPELGFPAGTDAKPHALAVALKGKFASAFADKPSPVFGAEEENVPAEADRTGRTIKESPPDTRLVVVGSSSIVHDMVLSMARQTGTEAVRNNLQFVQNLVDWAVEDVDSADHPVARRLRPDPEADG